MLIHAKMYLKMFDFLCKDYRKAKEKKGCFDDANHFGEFIHEFEGDDVEVISDQVGKRNTCVGATSKGKRKASTGIELYFKHGIANST